MAPLPKLYTQYLLSEAHLTQLTAWVQQEPEGAARTLSQTLIAVHHSNLVVGLVDEADRLVAFARVLTDLALQATIYDVTVDPAWRRQGVGRHLMHEVLSHPMLRQIPHIDLACPPAQAPFFTALGFTPAPQASRLRYFGGRASPFPQTPNPSGV